MAKFIQAHPKIQVSLSVANRDAVIKQLTENVADLAIMVGIGLLFLHSYRQDRAAKAAAAAQGPTS